MTDNRGSDVPRLLEVGYFAAVLPEGLCSRARSLESNLIIEPSGSPTTLYLQQKAIEKVLDIATK